MKTALFMKIILVSIFTTSALAAAGGGGVDNATENERFLGCWELLKPGTIKGQKAFLAWRGTEFMTFKAGSNKNANIILNYASTSPIEEGYMVCTLGIDEGVGGPTVTQAFLCTSYDPTIGVCYQN